MSIKRRSSNIDILKYLHKVSADQKITPGDALVDLINKDRETLYTSEWDNNHSLIEFSSGSRITSSVPSSLSSCVTESFINKIIGFQFAEILEEEVPNGSCVAFGSGFYSNDEQKTFALKYDFQVAKSPSKTQYYFLNEEEEAAIATIKLKSTLNDRLALDKKSVSEVFFSPSIIRDQIIAHFNSPSSYLHILNSLTLHRYWNNLCPRAAVDEEIATLRYILEDSLLDDKTKIAKTRNVLNTFKFKLNSDGKEIDRNGYPVDYSIIDAVVDGLTYEFLNEIPGKSFPLVHDYYRGPTPNLNYFKLVSDHWCNRSRPLVSQGKSYDVPCAYSYSLNPSEVADYNEGKDIVINIPVSDRFRLKLSYQRNVPGYSYNYNNNYHIVMSDIALPGSFSFTINKNTPNKNVAVIVNEEVYNNTTFGSPLDLDRLVGFLTENNDIKLISSKNALKQLVKDNPYLNKSTYDSLFGMISSTDENTRKTGIKMLQSFQLDEDSISYPALHKYIKSLAVDLVLNSNVTGASANKWMIKNTGENLSVASRRSRQNRYGRNNLYRFLYNNNNDNNHHAPFTFYGDYHPSVTYEERRIISEKMVALDKIIAEVYSSCFNETVKYYDYPEMCHVFSATNESIFNRHDVLLAKSSLTSLTSAEKRELDYSDLYIRHYVNYIMTRIFGGVNNHIHYDLNFKSPLEVQSFNATQAFVNTYFADFKRNFTALKQAALENPLKFYNLLSLNYSSYAKKYGMNTNNWEKNAELDYSIQHYANPNAAGYRKRQIDNPANYSVVVSSMAKLREDILNAYSSETLTISN